MKIKEVYIDGYGIYHHFHLTEEHFSAPITLFCGPNEAGKSTLHSFLKSILFGFQMKGVPALEPLQGGSLGGSITLVNEQGEHFQIVRKAPPKKGKVHIYLENGEEQGEAFLKQLLGNVSGHLFSQIFAFHHQELQHLESLQNEEVAAYLYGATMGSGSTNVLSIEKKLIRTQDQLFKPRASIPKLNKLLRELESRKEEIEELQREMSSYASLKNKLIEERERLDQLRQHRAELDEKRQWLVVVQQGSQLKKQAEEVLMELQSIPEADIVLSLQADIVALDANRFFFTEKEEELQRIMEQVTLAEQNISANLRSLGDGWSKEKVQQLDLSISVKDYLFQLAQQRRKIKEQLDQLEEKWQTKKEDVVRLQAIVDQDDQQINIPDSLAKNNLFNLITATRRRKGLSKYLVGIVLILISIIWLIVEVKQPLPAVLLFIGLLMMIFFLYQGQGATETEGRKFEQELSRLQKESQNQAEYHQREYRLAWQAFQQLEKEKISKKSEEEHTEALWYRHLSKVGLSPTLSADGLPEMLRKIEETWQEISKQEGLLDKKYQLLMDVEKWRNQVKHMATQTGIQFKEDHHPFLLLEMLKKQLALEEKQEKKREQLKQQLKQLEAQLELRIHHDDPQQKKNLQKAMNEWDEQEIQDQLDQIEDDIQKNLENIEERAWHIGQLQSRLNELEKEESLAYKQQEYQETKAQFQDLAKTWSIHALARHLCATARKTFEEERQPAVLKEASQFMAKITSDRYKQIIAPLGQQDLIVIRRDNERLLTSQLSQGTREQLYLSMRFALVKEYGKYIKLPIILDDIFVNFDSTRLRETLQGLVELAGTHQIIIFTCHDHLVKQIEEIVDELCPVYLSKLHHVEV